MSFPLEEFFTSLNTTLAFSVVILVYAYMYFKDQKKNPKEAKTVPTDSYALVLDSLDDETLEYTVLQLESIIGDLYDLQDQRRAQLIK